MDNEGSLETLIGQIPQSRATTENLKCCCGDTDCHYLKHSNLALDSLENDVRTAAQLGQALLVRHEQYMHEAERDRLELNTKIEQLESDKKELETQNARTIEENRELLDQLEGLNCTVLESETNIKSLEATLQSTHQELRRLELLASRTQELEIQLAALEQEQDLLQKKIITTEFEERSAIQRWKKAERGLYDLQEQLERIEREASEERERHVEVLSRMERQRVVDRELNNAIGRPKGAAATTGSVVTHFVKDILQDNANLQLGIVELREMLMASNDEVQTLREQILLHQPIDNEESNETLKEELTSKIEPSEKLEVPVVSQALHIHHHYHTTKKEEIRRPKKKRASLNPALFTPLAHRPRTPRGPETSSAILSQTSVTVPAPTTPNLNRWSMQSGQSSDFAPSSVPSSPQSIFRSSTLFDRGFDLDSSRPTSPGSSIDPMSPQMVPLRHRKRASEVSARSFVPSSNFQSYNVIHEEGDNDDVEEIPSIQSPDMPSLDENSTITDMSSDSQHVQDWTASFQPSLRRSTSHESILSISGIDIHTLKSRPSQITITGAGLMRPRSRIGTASTLTSIETVTAHAHANPTLSFQGHNSTAYLRSNILAPPNTGSDTRSISSSGSGEGISKKVGGWVFGRWGVTPAKSSGDLRAAVAAAAALPPKQRVVSTPSVDPLQSVFGRRPGINQKGPIPGFMKKAERAPSKVKPDIVDHAALNEILMEGSG